MNICTICGNKTESNIKFHNKCLKNMYGADYAPTIDLSLNSISIKAQEMAGKLSISGVQPKLSAVLNKKKKELIVTPEKGQYIIKPQTQAFPNLPENENLCMTIASGLGIQTPAHMLIKLKDGTYAFIIKRFDRVKRNKLHTENFFQILEKKEKYEGSLEQIGKKLKSISEVPGLDIQLFLELVVFNFVIGNGDAHMKNFSVIYDNEGHIRLSPAYDIVSSKLVIPGEEDSALTINGKKNKLTRADFTALADNIGIQKTGNIIDKIVRKEKLIKKYISMSCLKELQKNRLSGIVTERIHKLAG